MLRRMYPEAVPRTHTFENIDRSYQAKYGVKKSKSKHDCIEKCASMQNVRALIVRIVVGNNQTRNAQKPIAVRRLILRCHMEDSVVGGDYPYREAKRSAYLH